MNRSVRVEVNSEVVPLERACVSGAVRRMSDGSQSERVLPSGAAPETAAGAHGGAEFTPGTRVEVKQVEAGLAGSKYTGRVVQGPGGGSARHLHVKYDELHEVADERKLLCEKVLRSQAQILCEPSRAIRAREHEL